jgi:hypothetical protein
MGNSEPLTDLVPNRTDEANMKKQSKEVKASSVWSCVTCDAKEEMTQEQMLAHLKDAHALETKGLKCSRRMVMHMDGDTWFSSQYEVTIYADKGDISLVNSTMNPRAKDDMMRYA